MTITRGYKKAAEVAQELAYENDSRYVEAFDTYDGQGDFSFGGVSIIKHPVKRLYCVTAESNRETAIYHMDGGQ